VTDLERYKADLTGSDPERALAWQVKVARLPEPTHEYCFAFPRRWRFDLCWPAQMLAVEIEGGVYVAGRHSRGAAFTADCEKYAEALCLGWKVLRVVPAQIESGKALEWIERILKVEK
jgi:hypothetical protein